MSVKWGKKTIMQTKRWTPRAQLTHPVESMTVVASVVPLHQHLRQAAGMKWLGAHGYHTPLDEALHLRLGNQTSAEEKSL